MMHPFGYDYIQTSEKEIYARRISQLTNKAKSLVDRITMFRNDLEKSDIKKTDKEKILKILEKLIKT